MSGNHNQSLDRALEIVDAAAETGAHALKLQTYTADTITLDVRGGGFDIEDENSLWKGRNLHDLYKQAHTPWEWHGPIMERARKHGAEHNAVFARPEVGESPVLHVPADLGHALLQRHRPPIHLPEHGEVERATEGEAFPIVGDRQSNGRLFHGGIDRDHRGVGVSRRVHGTFLHQSIELLAQRRRYVIDGPMQGEIDANIPLPLDPPDIASAVHEALEAHHLDAASAALRITLTRGPGQRGLLPPEDPNPNLIISVSAYHPPATDDGFAVMTSKRARRNEGSLTARLKTLQYLDNIVAQTEAAAEGVDEALLLNNKGAIACGARSNLFAVIKGTLLTPAIEEGALPGITRATILQLAKELSVQVTETRLTHGDLAKAEEAFLSNSLLEIVPIRRFDPTSSTTSPRPGSTTGRSSRRRSRETARSRGAPHRVPLERKRPRDPPRHERRGGGAARGRRRKKHRTPDRRPKHTGRHESRDGDGPHGP